MYLLCLVTNVLKQRRLDPEQRRRAEAGHVPACTQRWRRHHEEQVKSYRASKALRHAGGGCLHRAVLVPRPCRLLAAFSLSLLFRLLTTLNKRSVITITFFGHMFARAMHVL